MQLSDDERALLRREFSAAAAALGKAKRAADPLTTLSELTAAVEALTSTQHELVNVLLDRGASWSMLAEALSTNSAGAQRRYPCRPGRRAAAADDTTT